MKIKRLIIILLVLILLFFILFMISFRFFYPEVRKLDHVEIDISSWNKDHDMKSLEAYYYINPLTLKIDEKISIYNFINKNARPGKREFSLKNPGDTAFYYNLASLVIINLFSLQSIEGYKLDNYRKQMDFAANYLMKRAILTDSTACWRMNFKYNSYNTDYNWPSAYQQGVVLSGLARYFQLTGDNAYYYLMNKAVHFCKVEVSQGGILHKVSDDQYVFEEYPAKRISSVLNGNIFCLLGIYDVYRSTGNKEAKELFDKGINFLLHHIGDYDLGYWSRYDLTSGFAASYGYHKRTHIPQLRILYQLTGHKIFEDTANKWEKYFNEPYYTVFKLKALKDAVIRRFRYKSFFSIG